MRGTYLARPNAAGIWEVQPIEPAGPSPPVAPGMEEAQTPEDVAAVDPMAGLMQMQVWDMVWDMDEEQQGSWVCGTRARPALAGSNRAKAG